MTQEQASAPQFDAYADVYDEEVNRSLAFTGMKVDYFTRVKTAYLLQLLRAHFGKTAGLAVLDVGCGTGNCHAELGDCLGSLTGTDVSAASIAQAAARHRDARYTAYDGHTLPFPDSSFDAVFTICVMHHVPPAQWQTFAAEMKRVARPGGLGLVFEHNPFNPLTRRVVSNCEFDEDAVLLRPRKVRSLMAGAGFSRVRSNTILSIPTNGSLTRRLDLVLGRLGLGAQYFATGIA